MSSARTSPRTTHRNIAKAKGGTDPCPAAGRTFALEQTVLPRHGRTIQTLQSTFLIRDEGGKPSRIAVVISDITERKRAEEALQQSHDELQAIYDGMVDGLFVTDVGTKRFLRANASICQMLGYTEAELLSMSVMDIHPPDALPSVLQRFQAQAEEHRDMRTDVPVVRKDGTVFPANVAGNTLIYKGRPCLLRYFSRHYRT